MKPAPFDYVRAGRVEDAVAALAAANEDGEGKVIAGGLHPLQQAFADCHGLQCGFCTPGFLISALHLLTENRDPTREEIRTGLSGNICRCTGYVGIVDAVRQAAVTMKD